MSNCIATFLEAEIERGLIVSSQDVLNDVRLLAKALTDVTQIDAIKCLLYFQALAINHDTDLFKKSLSQLKVGGFEDAALYVYRNRRYPYGPIFKEGLPILRNFIERNHVQIVTEATADWHPIMTEWIIEEVQTDIYYSHLNTSIYKIARNGKEPKYITIIKHVDFSLNKHLGIIDINIDDQVGEEKDYIDQNDIGKTVYTTTINGVSSPLILDLSYALGLAYGGLEYHK